MVREIATRLAPRHFALVLVHAVACGCSNMSAREQRALSGGAMGAAGGAAIGWLAGGGALTGALIGGGAGATIGALTAPSR